MRVERPTDRQLSNSALILVLDDEYWTRLREEK
jgi:hypothetical protein